MTRRHVDPAVGLPLATHLAEVDFTITSTPLIHLTNEFRTIGWDHEGRRAAAMRQTHRLAACATESCLRLLSIRRQNADDA